MRILFVGDIVGKQGRNALNEQLPFLREKYNYDLLIVNGENAAHGKGITKKIYDSFVSLNVDCVTLGNHTFSKNEIFTWINYADKLIRPANMEPVDIGNSVKIIDYQGYKIGIFNLYGNIFMQCVACSPFDKFEELLEQYPCDIRIVDFHGEATSEKYVFLRKYNQVCQLIVGTHTHIQTADEQIYGNAGFICDVGMTGPYDSVLGRDNDEVIDNLVNHKQTKYIVSENKAILSAVVADIDLKEKKCTNIERILLKP